MLLGAVALSATTTPFPLAADRDKTPPVKLAVAAPPSWAFRTPRKSDAVAGAPLTVMVPPEKTMFARACITPEVLVMAMVVWPLKPAMALSSDWPTLRPVKVVGAGTDEEAL